MSDVKIEWVPAPCTGSEDGRRWELRINDRYSGRVIKTTNGECNAMFRSLDKSAFSINDAGRKLLAYALEQIK